MSLAEKNRPRAMTQRGWVKWKIQRDRIMHCCFFCLVMQFVDNKKNTAHSQGRQSFSYSLNHKNSGCRVENSIYQPPHIYKSNIKNVFSTNFCLCHRHKGLNRFASECIFVNLAINLLGFI